MASGGVSVAGGGRATAAAVALLNGVEDGEVALPPAASRLAALLRANGVRVLSSSHTALPPSRGDPAHVVVGLSGGKDSAGAVIRLLGDGFRVTCVHVAGLNPVSRQKELQASYDVVRALGSPKLSLQVVGSVVHRGSRFVESPVKNVLVQAVCADAAYALGAAKYALGNLGYDARASDLRWASGWSDGQDVLLAGAEFVSMFAPGPMFIPYVVANDSDSFSLTTAAGVQASVSSCLRSARTRAFARTRVAKLFGDGVPSWPNRCFTCSKCAIEYLFLAATGHVSRHPGLGSFCATKLQEAADAMITSASAPTSWHDFFSPDVDLSWVSRDS